MNPWAKLKARKTGGPRRLPRLGTRPRPAPIAAGLPATQASRSARRSADRLLPLPAPPRPRGWRAGLGVKPPSRHPTSEPPGPSQRGAERKPFPGPGTQSPRSTAGPTAAGRPPARRIEPHRGVSSFHLPSPAEPPEPRAPRREGGRPARSLSRSGDAGGRRAAGEERAPWRRLRPVSGPGTAGEGQGRGGAGPWERRGRGERGGGGALGGERGDGRESRTGAGPGEGGAPREGEGKGRERDGGEGGVLRGRGGGGALGEEREGR